MTATDDERLSAAFTSLDPSSAAVERVTRRLAPAFEARPPPLWAEWLDVLRIRPLVHGTYALAAVGLGAAGSPAIVLALAVLRGVLRLSA